MKFMVLDKGNQGCDLNETDVTIMIALQMAITKITMKTSTAKSQGSLTDGL